MDSAAEWCRMPTKIATDDNFEELLRTPGAVFVMFYWPKLHGYWRLRKAIHQAVASFGDRLTFVKLNTQRCPRTARRYQEFEDGYWLYLDGVRIADRLGSFSYIEREDTTEFTRGQIIEWINKHLFL